MTYVKCENKNCEYCDLSRNVCAADFIEMDDECYCLSFEEYEPKKPKFRYWKAMQDFRNKNEYYRGIAEGYMIKYKDVVFYTEDDERCGDDRWLTEEKSGLGICSLADMKVKFDMIKERLANAKNVMDLPTVSGEWVYTDERKIIIKCSYCGSTRMKYSNEDPPNECCFCGAIMNNTKIKHFKYDMIGSIANHHVDMHPQEDMQRLGFHCIWAEPVPVADCWWFRCDEYPEEYPDYIIPMKDDFKFSTEKENDDAE